MIIHWRAWLKLNFVLKLRKKLDKASCFKTDLEHRNLYAPLRISNFLHKPGFPRSEDSGTSSNTVCEEDAPLAPFKISNFKISKKNLVA